MIKFNTRFGLYNRANADGTRAVRMRVTWAGNRLDHTLPIAIEPRYWDDKGMRVKSSYHPNGDLLACARANDIITSSRDSVDRFFAHCEVDAQEAAVYSLKEWLDPAKDYLHTAPRLRLFSEVANDCISESSVTCCWSLSTITHMQMAAKNVESYRPGVKLGEIDGDFLNGFVEHLYNQGNRNNTVRHKVQQIRWILRWADKKGYPVSQTALHFERKFKGTSSSFSEVIYLSWEELMQLRDYPFKHHRKLAQTRDVFLFGCFSGLRYSDLAALKKVDVSDGRIRVITQKTTNALNIELNQYTREILDRYADMDMQGYALPVPSLRVYNSNLKRMAKMAGLDAPTRKVHFVKNERIETILPKYEIISSHCARRSFVVNALRLGIPVEVIMSWTGHSDYDAMKPYVKIVDELKTTSMAKFDGDLSASTLPEIPAKVPAPKKAVSFDGPAPWRRSISHLKNLRPAHKEQMISIMDEVAKGEMVFQVDLAEHLGLSLESVRRRMHFLSENGYLKCSGWGRKTKWEVVQK